jgi:L-ribulokinase
MPGQRIAPGEPAGVLSPKMARKLGLKAGITVSAAVIDAHAGVPGAGVSRPDVLVMVMGTSSCHMLNAREEKRIPGVAGVVEGGILPGYFGYETGQAAVGDSFDWFRRIAGQRGFEKLDAWAAHVPPGSDGVLCMDWFNGCRTPLMDGALTGAFTGLTLNHHAGHLYRAVLEASALGLRWIVEVLRDGGLAVRQFVATGGLPHHSPLLMQIYADALGEKVTVHPSKQGPALGAAILGVLAAGRKVTGFSSASAAMKAMAAADPDTPGREPRVLKPHRRAARAYDEVYRRYRQLAEQLA